MNIKKGGIINFCSEDFAMKRRSWNLGTVTPDEIAETTPYTLAENAYFTVLNVP